MADIKTREKSPEEQKKDMMNSLRDEKEFMTLRASIAKAYYEEAAYSMQYRQLIAQQQAAQTAKASQAGETESATAQGIPTPAQSTSDIEETNINTNESEGDRVQEPEESFSGAMAD